MAEILQCPHGHQWTAGKAGDLPAGQREPCPVCSRGAATLSFGPEPRLATRNAPTISHEPAAAAAALAVQELSGPELVRRPLGRAAKSLPQVPGYEILEVLGRGGMGIVYKARQKSLNRIVALKMIRAGAHADATELARFRAEAEAAARLQHPNIVQVYEVGEHDGRPYFSLEFVAGGSLKQKLDRTPQPPRAAAELTETLALAIQNAHDRGIIHRDLKPANILLAAEDAEVPRDNNKVRPPRSAAAFAVNCIPKITDFGLAKQLDVDAGQTQSGTILGTPSYMAPEQAAGKIREIGPAADVYALGVMLYEMLTGRPPFHAANMLDTLEQVRTLEPLPPRRLQPKVPRDLETICLKCLQKEPRQRYHSARALADDLRRFLEGQPITARPTPLWERGLKWVARRPAISGLGLLAMAVSLFGFALVMGQRYEAERRGDEAERAEAGFQASRANARRAQEAFEQETLTAQDETREAETARLDFAAKHYFNNVSLADQAFWNSLPSRAEELLDRCPPSLCQWEWYYLKRLCHDALLALPGVDTVACSPDGTLLASAGAGRTVKIWDAATGREIHSIDTRKDASPVRVAFDPDGSRLAACYDNGTARVWEVATAKELAAIQGHNSRIWDVSFSPDGQQLATAGHDGTVSIWEASTGKLLHIGRGHKGPVTGVAFSKGGQLATGGADATIRLWDPATGKEKQIMTGNAAVRQMAFSPDGTMIATAIYGGVSLWDPVAARFLRHLGTHPIDVKAVAFRRDGQVIAAGGVDGSVVTCDPVSGRDTRVYRGLSGAVRGLAFSPDGQRLAATGQDSLLHVWQTVVTQGSQHLPGHTGQVSGVAMSPDRKHFATSGADGVVKVWDAATCKEILSWEACTAMIYGVAYSPDGKRLATAGGDHLVRVWDAQTGRALQDLKGHGDDVMSVAFSGDGKQIASASSGFAPGVKVWDANTGKEIRALEGERVVAYSRDGKHLASLKTAIEAHSTEMRIEVRVWEAASGRLVHTFRRPETSLFALAFSPDGSRIAAAGGQFSHGKEIYVWELATGQELLAISTKGRANLCLAFSPDGRRIAAGSVDNTISLWDTLSGREVLTLRGHIQGILSVAFTADGQRLFSASADRTLRVWDARPHPAPRTLRGHTDSVSCGRFSPDGRLFATASSDRTVVLWDTATWQPLQTLTGHGGTIRELAFSPDGRRVATAGRGDHVVNVWDVDPGGTKAQPKPAAKLRLTFRRHTADVLTVAFSPDGRRLASGDERGSVKVWDADTGAEIYEVLNVYDYVLRLCFSPGGETLAVAGGNQPSIKLCDAATGRILRTLDGHTGQVVNQIVFSPDGQFLVSGGGDRTVKIWNVPTGRLAKDCHGHSGYIFCVAVSPDGKYLASGCTDWAVKVWDRSTGQCVHTWYDHTAVVTSICFSPDGRLVASGSTDETAKVWTLARP